MKFNKFFIVALGCFGALNAANDERYIYIKNNYSYPIELFISKLVKREFPQSFLPTMEAGETKTEPISGIRQIGFKGQSETEFTNLFESFERKGHERENLHVNISAPYGGYGAWQVDKQWRDPAELEDEWVKVDPQASQQEDLSQSWIEVSG